MSTQQTNYRREKFHTNHSKPFKKFLVKYKSKSIVDLDGIYRTELIQASRTGWISNGMKEDTLLKKIQSK